MQHPMFLIYGVMLLGLTGFAEYNGWSPTRVNEVRNVPKTIRDNPGAYRSIYGGFARYTGGK
ncbi:MAG: hypothetical protein ABSH09_15855 [Bryobacteraceae bacterium]|jgi:hypothetical protein